MGRLISSINLYHLLVEHIISYRFSSVLSGLEFHLWGWNMKARRILVTSWVCSLLVYEQDKAASWKVRFCIPKYRWREPEEKSNIFNTTSLICSMASQLRQMKPSRWMDVNTNTESTVNTKTIKSFHHAAPISWDIYSNEKKNRSWKRKVHIFY